MTNVCLVVLVGIPASGKTTFCKAASDYLSDKELQVKTVHYDELCSDYSSAARSVVFEIAEGLIADYTKRNCKHVLLIDDNMYYKSMRSQYINLAKKHRISYFQVFFQTDLPTALLRNANRTTNKIPERIILKMFEDIEVPSKDVLIIDSTRSYDDSVFEEFEVCIRKHLGAPLKEIVVHSEPETLSKLQQVDLILRKCVGEKVAADVKSARKCNTIRRVVLKNIRNGNIEVDCLDELQLKCMLISFFEV